MPPTAAPQFLAPSSERLNDILPVTKQWKSSTTKKLGPLSRDDAKALSAEIRRRQFHHLWLLIERAHEGGAQQALGFSNWRDYTRQELDLSESRSFQLLDQAKIMRVLQRAGLDPLAIDPVPARVVAKLKHSHDEVLATAQAALQRNSDVQEALRELAQQVAPVSTANRSRAPQTGEVVCPTCNGHGAVPEMTARLWERFMSDLG